MTYKHLNQLGNKFKNVTISESTLASDDLLKTFLGFLFDADTQLWNEVIEEWSDVVTDFVNNYPEHDDEQTSFLIEELFNIFTAIAPEGCYFGSTEGDGACFGFWETESVM